MEILKFVFLLIGLWVFAASILSTFVVILVIAIAGWVAEFAATGSRKPGEITSKIRRFAGQEGS